MKKPSEPPGDWDDRLARIVGFGERSMRKSHYPELRRRQVELEAANEALVAEVQRRQQAEEALRTSLETYRRMIETSLEGIISIDERSCITFTNGRMCELLGYEADELLNRPLAEFVVPEERADHEERMRQRRSGRAEQYERRYRHRDGHVVVMLTSATPVFDEAGQYRGAFLMLTDVTDRRQAEQGLRASELRFRSLFEQCPIGLAVYDATGRVLSINQAAADMFGLGDRTTAVGWNFFDDPNLPADAGPRLRAGETVRFEVHYDNVQAQSRGLAIAHARPRDFDVIFTPLRPAEGQPIEGFVLLAQDFTERKRLEAQLLQAQKMEAVGQLAGGVAHDFNNILTAILGNTELALGQLVESRPRQDSVLEGLRQIERSATRAADLTRQLLAFSRRQTVQPRIVDVCAALVDMEKMLRRVLTENIALTLRCDRPLWRVRIDPVQLEQIITNLAVNARDAMPGGGLLVLETHNVELDEEYVRLHADARPGPHLVLVVSDTGSGMDATVLERIFEPFYTTKGLGQGTGLGLATVYGIVRQAGGHIEVYSEPGHGSAFRVYLPAVTDAKAPLPTAGAPEAPRGGHETILLCEDDPAVRDLAVQVLARAGYAVLAAENGARGFDLAAAHGGALDLLVTDVIMPDTDGRQLADRLRQVRPGLRVLFTSGYTADVIGHHGVLNPSVEFLEKPFNQVTLLRRVREALDAPPGGRAPGPATMDPHIMPSA